MQHIEMWYQTLETFAEIKKGGTCTYKSSQHIRTVISLQLPKSKHDEGFFQLLSAIQMSKIPQRP